MFSKAVHIFLTVLFTILTNMALLLIFPVYTTVTKTPLNCLKSADFFPVLMHRLLQQNIWEISKSSSFLNSQHPANTERSPNVSIWFPF